MSTTVTKPPIQQSLSRTFAEWEKKPTHRDSKMGTRLAVLYVTLTTIILAYGALFGFIAILVMYAIWLPRIYFRGRFTLKLTPDTAPVFVLPALGIISVVWSDYPLETIYKALEYASMIIITVIIARVVRTPAFMRGVVIGSTLVIAASMASDHYGFDPLSGTYTLIGLFGSKNQIGLFAEIGILFAVIGLSVRQRFVEKMAFTLIPIMVFALSLYLSKSVSSIISLAVILMAMCAAAFIGRMPRSFRTIVLIGFTLTVIMVGLFGAAFDVQDTVLKGFGKNATLTGRTFLWQEAINSGMKAPILGHGYAAFWVEGQPKAEQLWMKFGVTTKVGFHFHNVFLEVFVELGALGVAIIVFIMLANCWKSTRALLRNGMSVEYMYALGVSIMFLIRAMVEVDIIGTFSVGPLLFFSVLPRLADLERVKRDASPSKHGKEAATGSLTTMRMRQY